ncbi:hypothetical protein LTR37_000839 [Vermiconidia calcicola]|uniref:Uncharacterized protein n=1 Tax=Vermiconidia calcicola TaxID=1690605 RepID=A0ACC3NXJ8_9PEZI|nr:hypothetical protein LTR37_000839 [Vermiconidia calcicola]
MGWRTSFHSLVETPIPDDIDAKALINAFHDHDFLITMQPIVTRHEIRDRDPESGKLTYDVWEAISVLPFGLWKQEIQFTCAFTDKKDGTISAVEAPMGFTSEATYSIKAGEQRDGEGDGWVIEESIETTCPMIFRWFVESTMVSARRKMHEQVLDHVRDNESQEREREDRRSEASRLSGGVERPTGNYI